MNAARVSCVVVLALFVAASSGCIQVGVTKSPAYSKAMEMEGSERPRLFFSETVNWQGFPSMSPYAVIFAQGRTTREILARRIWQEAAKLHADVVVVSESESKHVGDTSVYWGFGVSSSQPVFSDVAYGTCYRTCPSKLGVDTDANSMVVRLDADSPLREAGLLEGDTVVSFNGAAWSGGESGWRAPRYAMALDLTPGQEIVFIWIRPGTGRMEGRATCAENTGVLPKEDSLPWQQPYGDDEDRSARKRYARR